MRRWRRRRREEGRMSHSIISNFLAWRLVVRSRSSRSVVYTSAALHADAVVLTRAVACTGAAVYASIVVYTGSVLHMVAA
eukprot:4097745-Pyramimonas_sp.AAC.1